MHTHCIDRLDLWSPVEIEPDWQDSQEGETIDKAEKIGDNDGEKKRDDLLSQGSISIIPAKRSTTSFPSSFP